MFPRDNPGAYWTIPGMIRPEGGEKKYFLLVYKSGKHRWTEENWSELDEDQNTGWSFIEGEDEHLIEGAALVAPLSILFWEDK